MSVWSLIRLSSAAQRARSNPMTILLVCGSEHSSPWRLCDRGNCRRSIRGIWNPNISCRAKNFQMIDFGLPVKTSFLWSHLLNGLCGRPVQKVDCSEDHFRPKVFWNISMLQHRLSHLNDCTVPALNNTVLLRGVRCGKLILNAM